MAEKENLLKYFKREPKEGGDTNTLSYRRSGRENLEKLITALVNSPRAAEITITFRESYRKLYDDYEIVKLIEAYMKDSIEHFDDIEEILLVSEYGDNHQLHFHGVIIGRARDLSQLLTYMKRRFGRTTIRMIKYPESYKKYLLKEQPNDDVSITYVTRSTTIRLID